jgi:hypothetical protein
MYYKPNLTQCQALTDHHDTGAAIVIHEAVALKRGREVVGLELAVLDTVENPLDKFSTEDTCRVTDTDNLTDKVAIVDMGEIHAFNDITNFHFVLPFVHHVSIMLPWVPKVKPF